MLYFSTSSSIYDLFSHILDTQIPNPTQIGHTLAYHIRRTHLRISFRLHNRSLYQSMSENGSRSQAKECEGSLMWSTQLPVSVRSTRVVCRYRSLRNAVARGAYKSCTLSVVHERLFWVGQCLRLPRDDGFMWFRLPVGRIRLAARWLKESQPPLVAR